MEQHENQINFESKSTWNYSIFQSSGSLLDANCTTITHFYGYYEHFQLKQHIKSLAKKKLKVNGIKLYKYGGEHKVCAKCPLPLYKNRCRTKI